MFKSKKTNESVRRFAALALAFLMVFQYTAAGLSVYSWAEDGTDLETQELAEEKAETEKAESEEAEKPVQQEPQKKEEAPQQPEEKKEDPPAEEPVAEQKQEEPEQKAEEPEKAQAEQPEEEPEQEPEKESEEKPEEEKESFPAQTFTKSAGGVTVRISAPKGALPEDSSVKVTAVAASRVESAVQEAAGKDVNVIKALDITFFDKEGKEIEPEKRVSVNFENGGFSKLEHPEVYHIENSGAASKLADKDVGTYGSQVSISAKDFSIYVVVEGDPDPDARLFVNFYEADGETLIASMSLTKNQLEAGQMNTNIYDPGVGTMTTGQVFKGWTDKKDYTAADAESAMNISGVRSKVRALLDTGTVTDGTDLNIYAMIYDSYHVSYRDELGVTVHTDEVLYRKGAEQIPYTIQFTYTPYYVTGSDEEDEDKAANFDGWNVVDTTTDPETLGTLYQNGSEINMADEDLPIENLTLTLLAKVSYGHWLVFNENGSGVSYTPPLFVNSNSTPEAAGMPDGPKRTGYTFGGWYMEAGCTTEFDPNQPITKTTNVWAKWTENTDASFTVLIWEERLSGGYNFVRSISIDNAHTGDNMAEAIDGNVGASTITVDGESVFIPMTSDETKANAGFMYEKFDTNAEDNKVASNGTSVLNIYFERRTYTLKFYYARSQGGRYQVSQNYDAPTAHGNSGTSTGGTWVPGGNQRPTTAPGCTFGGSGTETRGNYTYYYRTLTAEYGEEISGSWPTYDQFSTFSNYRLGSWAIMHTSQAYIDDGQGTIKGKITVMDEHILGNLASADGNYVYANYDTAASQYDWTYNIYFMNEEGDGYELIERVTARSHDSGSNWQTQQHPPAYPGMEEVRRERVGNNREINYYYDPLDYPILFKDGVYVDGSGTTIKNNNSNTLKALQDANAIAYKSDVSEYNSYDPTSEISDGSNYVFVGWYTDDQCKTQYDFDKMPIGGITVYAKWVLKEYKVILHPENGNDDSFRYKNGQRAGEYAYHESTGDYSDDFYVDNGEKVDNVGGTRDLYDLIGWFTNENLTKVWDFDAFTMNDTIVGKYGKLYSEDEIDPRYPGTVGEVKLYASWRRILDGADGIDIVYTAVGKDDEGNEVEGTDPPKDPNKYSDQAQAIARPSATAPEGGDPPLAFQYWVVQKWDKDQEQYVDTDPIVKVYPSDRFTVKYDDARISDITYEEDGTTIKSAKYTVQLRAHYGSTEEATPTHITWYNNYVDDENGIIRKDEPLVINEKVNIPEAPTREGFTFLGWAKEPETKSGETTINYSYEGLTENDLFLIYDDSGETPVYKYTSGEVTKTAKGVFADENTPYDGMYAVWEANKYTVKFDKNDDNATGSMEDQVFRYDEKKELTANAFTNEGYVFAGWNTKPDGSGDSYSDKQEVEKLTAEKDGKVTLYAQWKQKVEVTFKVENGEWNSGGKQTIVVEVAVGSKLTQDQIPAAGNKPDDTYKAGSWDVTPSADIEITADTTYTYTYVQKDSISVTVTFKVENGAWNDETTGDKTVTLTGYEGDTLKLTEDQIPAAGNKPDDTYKAGSWDVIPSADTEITEDTTYTYTYVKKDSISVTVTFKVENGAWNDETTGDKTVTLTGYEGDELKLSADQIPAAGDKPDADYKAGAWETEPSTETVITKNTTYTYKYAPKKDISAKVTFKVVNGEWNNGGSNDIVVNLIGKEGDTLKLSADQIPAAGNKPDDTYKAGSWNVTPSSETEITEDTTYTYTYVKKESISAKVTFKVVNGSWDDKTGDDAKEDITVTLTGYEGDELKLSADQIPAVGNTPDTGHKAGAWDTTPDTDTVITGNDTVYTYTYEARTPKSVTVTFKVVNGAWSDETTEDITVTLNGYEGDELKLSANQIPIVGSQPAAGYQAGNWDTTPDTSTAIDEDVTYTYTYEPIPPTPTYSVTVTFKVVNGAWNDQTTEDKTVTLTGEEGTSLYLSAGDIPAAGSQPDAGYKAGAWDTTPDTTTPITQDTTYTYTYAEKETIVVTITGNKDTKEYSGSEQTVTGYTVDIPEGADFTEADISFAGNDEAKGTNAGSYPMGLSQEDFSVDSTEYTVTFSVTDGSLTITPKEVTVTADDKSKYEGQKDPELTYKVDGLVGDDTVEVSITRAGGEKPGKYDIIPSGEEEQGNYIVKYVKGTLTIKKVPPIPPEDDDDDDDPTPRPGGGGNNPGGGNPGGNPGVNPPAGPAPVPPITPQVIDDPDTPLDPGEDIDEPDTPLAPAEPEQPVAVWALINLLCTIVTVILSLLALIFYLGKSKKEEKKENEDGTETTEKKDVKKKGLLRLIDIIPAVVAVIVFILTEDMSNPMVLVDQWTLLMVVILIVGIICTIFTKKKVKDADDDDDEQEEAAQA